MANLDVVEHMENADSGTLTLVIKDRDNSEDLGAYYHYAATPPRHTGLTADQWLEQIGAHALALEAKFRGVDPPARAHPTPGQLGAAPEIGETLSASDAVELENLRAVRAAARDRAELEQLRRERQTAQTAQTEPPTA